MNKLFELIYKNMIDNSLLVFRIQIILVLQYSIENNIYTYESGRESPY